MSGERWSREHGKLAFHLYCLLPFGRLDQRNPEIIELAKLIGRSPGAVAMKLVNFASLDPAITTTGRTGLGHVSRSDREIWDEFHADWEGLALDCHELHNTLRAAHGVPHETVAEDAAAYAPQDFTGETRAALVKLRIKQEFFRRSVLSAYNERCCMSGISEPRLLIASHIVPWKEDAHNRLNPQNGLCLSAIHDRAFDQHLVSLTDDFRVIVGAALKKRSGEELVQRAFLSVEGRPIELPGRFRPGAGFIARHREVFFEANQ